ncbi:MAG: LysR substrate-binding domain-containing protein [Alphaproteobacteria bacterium]|nr:LysR substrate-binding domain-containing protein [Alphaproteobacteria bacterium]
MYFTQLRSFQAVALEGSFTGAAERLNLSQPTITQQVGDLEGVFDVELFHRQGRRVELSEVGKSLLTITERIFTTNEEAIELLEAASGKGTGHLRISAVGPLDVIPIISPISDSHPGVKISLTICNSEEAHKSLLDFRADVAMLASTQMDPRLHYVDFASRPLVLYVNKQHRWANRKRVNLKDLQGQRMIIRESGSQTRLIFEKACAKANIAPGQRIEINNRDAFREAVAQGLGIGVIGDRGLAPDSRLHRIPLGDAGIRMYRQLACLKERKDARLIKAFLDTGQAMLDRIR